jgi:hypothetical protein
MMKAWLCLRHDRQNTDPIRTLFNATFAPVKSK